MDQTQYSQGNTGGCQILAKPWQATLECCQDCYLSNTRDLGLMYQRNGTGKLYLEGWFDVDWASNLDERCSIVAYAFTISRTALTWSCKLLPTICLSSAEPKYGALSWERKELVSIRMTMLDIGQKQDGPMLLNSESQSAIALASITHFYSRTRHITVAQHFTKYLV